MSNYLLSLHVNFAARKSSLKNVSESGQPANPIVQSRSTPYAYGHTYYLTVIDVKDQFQTMKNTGLLV